MTYGTLNNVVSGNAVSADGRVLGRPVDDLMTGSSECLANRMEGYLVYPGMFRTLS